MQITWNCSFGSLDSPCGPVGNNTTILPLRRCDRDMKSLLSSLGVSLKRSVEQKSKISEVQLILNRAGLINQREEEQVETMTICPKHWKNFTLDWPGRKSSTCSHPKHKGQRKQMKTFRRVNASMSDEIFAIYDVSVPIGSGRFLSDIDKYID